MQTSRLYSTAFAICFAACAGRELVPPASAPSEPDPMADIVGIPPGACLGLDDHFAISTRGVVALLQSVRKRETTHAIELAHCQGAASLAEERQRQAQIAAGSAEFWLRWGPIVGAAIGIVVGASVPTAVLLLRPQAKQKKSFWRKYCGLPCYGK